MLYRKHNTLNRTHIVICPAELEDFSNAEYKDEYVLTILNQKYNQDCFETPPYHYIVSKTAITQVKSLELQHNDSSYLAAFNDDIKILLLNNNNLFFQIENLAELISELSITYSLSISSALIFAKSGTESLASKSVDSLMQQSINLRNKKYPIMAVSEAIVDGQIITNEFVTPISNRLNFTNLSQYANQYSIPIKTLQMLNPHLINRRLLVSDTIFLPNATSIDGIRYAGKCKKIAQYHYDKSKQFIENGDGLNG